LNLTTSAGVIGVLAGSMKSRDRSAGFGGAIVSAARNPYSSGVSVNAGVNVVVPTM
jgi:hypothetical protein